MSRIREVLAREILDSRGNPTVSASVVLEDGSAGTARVPSGASTGAREALELRDGDPKRFGGKGVLKAVENVNEKIRPRIRGRDARHQDEIDALLIEIDGTREKRELGANAILAVSLAVAHAAAAAQGTALYRRFNELAPAGTPQTMPAPMLNILNGGVHAHGSTDLQEFMVYPTGLPDFSSALRAGVEIYAQLKKILQNDGHQTTVGDEGGFAPAGLTTRQALDYLVAAIESAGYTPGVQVSLALDAAASEFFDESQGRYVLRREGATLDAAGMIDMYEELIRAYPIVSLEDGLAEGDWSGWTALNQRLGPRVQLVGDDLFVTQTEYVQRGIDEHCANSVLIKLNQVGTVTETLKTIELARQAGWGTVISHRSGETEDTSIADLAVGANARQIKTGAPARGERIAKYNRLLQIEDELGGDTPFGPNLGRS